METKKEDVKKKKWRRRDWVRRGWALLCLFVLISMSVIIQVVYFKLSGGKRVLKMAPLQHHFELKGWAEVTVVVRFWIIAGLCVAAGLGIFYAEWVVGL